jgi:hypothetical protein
MRNLVIRLKLNSQIIHRRVRRGRREFYLNLSALRVLCGKYYLEGGKALLGFSNIAHDPPQPTAEWASDSITENYVDAEDKEPDCGEDCPITKR